MQTFQVLSGDIPFSSSTGRPFLLEGTEKFKQDVRENFQTEAQADGTGAGLASMVGLIGDIFSLRAEFSSRLVSSFAAYKALQDRFQKFDRPPEERFGRIAQTIMMPLRDPSTGAITNTSIAARVDVLSFKGSQPVSVSSVLLR